MKNLKCLLFAIIILFSATAFAKELPEVVDEISASYLIQNFSSQTLIGYNEKVGGLISCRDNVTDELVISWNELDKAEEYELEYTFADDYSGDINVPLSTSQIFYDFSDNSTRVTLKDNYYRFPLLYERGYILYRVRAIGRGGMNLEQPVYCAWTDGPDNGPVSLFVNNYYHKISHMNDNMNWQVMSSFAEDGKRSDVINYFDGTFRGRQTVTGVNLDRNKYSEALTEIGTGNIQNQNLNTTKRNPVINSKPTSSIHLKDCAKPGRDKEREVIAGETVYDFQGRPAVNILPVPTNSKKIEFLPGLNRSKVTEEPYNWTDFDGTGYNCTNINALSSSLNQGIMGASAYYSANNPKKNDFNAFIPDAEGYPFTQISYLQDNTNRVAAQSSVGKIFRLGQAQGQEHDTRFYYAAPDQTELDRMFGTEAGYALRYQKNAVRDPNGQVSVTYLNPEGKTIATALAGKSPENLDPLDNQTTNKVNISLMDKNLRNDADKTLIVEHQFIVTSDNTEYTFDYSLDPETIGIKLCGSNIYSTDVVYELTITLNHLEKCTPDPVFTHTEIISKTNIPQIYNKFFTVKLAVGTYNLSKTLKANETTVLTFAEEVLKDSCIWESILQKQLDKIDTMDCYTNFVDSFPPNRCDIVRGMMLADLSPGGQYAKFTRSNNGQVTSSDNVSIFNENNNLHRYNYNSTDDPYLTGTYIIYLRQIFGLPSLTFNDFCNFVDNWQEDYAEKLLPLHPEYPLLGWCKLPIIDETLDFDTKISLIETFEDAELADYVKKYDGSQKVYMYLLNEDPYFKEPSSNSINPWRDAMLDKLKYYGCDVNNTKAIDELAMEMAYCASQNQPTPDMNDPALLQSLQNNNIIFPPCVPVINHTFGNFPGREDLEWTFLRTLYLSAKDELISESMGVYLGYDYDMDCIDNNGYNTSSGFTTSCPPCKTNQNLPNNYYKVNEKRFITDCSYIFDGLSTNSNIHLDMSSLPENPTLCDFKDLIASQQSDLVDQFIANWLNCSKLDTNNVKPRSNCSNCGDIPARQSRDLLCEGVVKIPPSKPIKNDCVKRLLDRAHYNAMNEYYIWQDDKRQEILNKYYESFFASAETFDMEYKDKQYHYTLYYYDQAGNLVKTIPPAGVDLLSGTKLAAVKTSRDNGYIDEVLPEHKKVTRYNYNTLNQVTEQKTPDAGESKFLYDGLGRIAASQNAKQITEGSFAYLLYDKLGRVTESGKVKPTVFAIKPETTRNFANWKSKINNETNRTEINLTKYDEPYSSGISQKFGIKGQLNLRSRVASVFSFNNALMLNDSVYAYATHYTYDIAGNVYKIVQDCPNGVIGDKTVEYDYDLQSGKVNGVVYQKGKADQFMHNYFYDAMNRIVKVETSRNGIAWDIDAEYFYYRHGPLARMELGTDKVQGLDYFYTLQGFIKGVNGQAISPETDMGGDGLDVAHDAFGYVLDYFSGDYNPIESSSFISAIQQNAGNLKELYNGNISRMYTQIQELGNNGYNYTYDQLNRIKAAEAWNIVTTNNPNPLSPDQYNTAYSYDPDGNLITLNRNGHDTNNPVMDRLNYHYYKSDGGTYNPTNNIPDNATNRLSHVIDDDTNGAYNDDYNDLKSQNTGNYKYDEIGNLISDVKEDIKKIKWNLQGKVSEVMRSSHTKPSLKFEYDPMGQRIEKKVTYYPDTSKNFTDYYTRDAQGNVMAVYRKSEDASNKPELRLTELPIYGSSRIGVLQPDTLIAMSGTTTNTLHNTTEIQLIHKPLIDKPKQQQQGAYYSEIRGKKQYELTNHLGNVLATITDRKLSDATVNPTHYTAELASAQDYYPFGMIMPKRSITHSDNYRYGFGGQEKDNKIYGDGNSYTAEYWQYDARLGRRWNVDPVDKQWESSYATYGDNPILYVDPFGEDWWVAGSDIKQEGQIMHQKGDVLFKKGTSNMPFSGEWELLGEDLMFGEDVIKGEEEIYFGTESAKKFMNEQGYEMRTRSEEMKVTERTYYVNEGQLGGQNVAYESTEKESVNGTKKITYVPKRTVISKTDDEFVRRLEVSHNGAIRKITEVHKLTYEYGEKEQQGTGKQTQSTINTILKSFVQPILWEYIESKSR